MSLSAIVLVLAAQAAPVDDWIRRLGADRIEERAEAQGNLMGLAKEARDAALVLERIRVTAHDATSERLARLQGLLQASFRKALPEDRKSIQDLNEEDGDILRKLRSHRVTLDMQNAPLTAIVDYLRELTGLNMHIQGAEADDLMISTKARDAPVSRLLDEILIPRRMTHLVQDGVVLIVGIEAAKKRVKLELYDVQDLSEDHWGFLCNRGKPKPGEQDGEALAELMRKDLFPGEWKEAEGKSLQYQNGLLIIRNRPEVHHAIRRFLAAIRAGVPWTPAGEPSPRIAALFEKVTQGTDEERAGAEREIEALGAEAVRAWEALKSSESASDPEVRARARSIRAGIAELLSEAEVLADRPDR